MHIYKLSLSGFNGSGPSFRWLFCYFHLQSKQTKVKFSTKSEIVINLFKISIKLKKDIESLEKSSLKSLEKSSSFQCFKHRKYFI